MLLRDENVNVVKRAILTMTQLYKVALQVGAPSPPGRPGLTRRIHRLTRRSLKAGSGRSLSERDVLLVFGNRRQGI